jgi:hypothetical protein
MSAKARLNFWISPRSHPGHFAARFRLANRVQLTSDGHKAYLEAVEGAFGSDIDYAMLVKVVEGNPDPKHVSTSYAAPRSRSRERVRRDLSITPVPTSVPNFRAILGR